MKVFKSEVSVERYNGGCGGLILVAANTPEEALQTAAKQCDELNRSYFVSYDEKTSKEYLELYYCMTPFEEVSGLNFETEESKIICENIFFE